MNITTQIDTGNLSVDDYFSIAIYIVLSYCPLEIVRMK